MKMKMERINNRRYKSSRLSLSKTGNGKITKSVSWILNLLVPAEFLDDRCNKYLLAARLTKEWLAPRKSLQ